MFHRSESASRLNRRSFRHIPVYGARRGRVSLLIGLIGAAACSSVSPADPLMGEALVRGPVESIDHRATASGVLVRAAPGSREMCGIAATVDNGTQYFRRAAGELRPAALADLTVGDTVEVYVDGPVAESCPVQGRASAIVIVGG